jgi:hypothetical protein
MGRVGMSAQTGAPIPGWNPPEVGDPRRTYRILRERRHVAYFFFAVRVLMALAAARTRSGCAPFMQRSVCLDGCYVGMAGLGALWLYRSLVRCVYLVLSSVACICLVYPAPLLVLLLLDFRQNSDPIAAYAQSWLVDDSRTQSSLARSSRPIRRQRLRVCLHHQSELRSMTLATMKAKLGLLSSRVAAAAPPQRGAK